MLWPADWELCRKPDCRDVQPVFRPQDRFFTHQKLLQCKTDSFRMTALRGLLRETGANGPFSDDEAIDRVADLLISGRVHLHAASDRPTQVRGTAPASSEAPKFVPFPLSQ